MTSPPKRPGRLIWVVFVGLIILLPWITDSSYIISVMLMVGLMAVLAMGMGILVGQGGLLSLAHPTWFGMGAYIAGILSAQGVMPTFPSILVAAAVVGVIAYVIGAPVLRLRGDYLACATFAIMVIAGIAAAQLSTYTGGPEGLLGIPYLSIGGYILKTDRQFYYLAWGLCLACYWFSANLLGSSFGRAIKSFHDSELASQAAGVNIARYKLHIFVVTAVMASLAGSLFCFYLRFAVPESFGFALLVELLMMVVIGGMEDLRGPLIGSFAVLWLTELIHAVMGKILPRVTGEVDALFFGVLIILVLIFMPRGLTGWADQILALGKARRSDSNDAAG